ncbi:MAG: SMI1/KNR4 family protein [Verrucomicrobiota bacterium]
MEIRSSLPTLTEPQLLEFRSRFSIPDDYAWFLLNHNGGEPIPSMFNVEMGDNSNIDEFFGIGGNQGNDIELNLPLLTTYGISGYLPIGIDISNSFLLIRTEQPDFGSVHFHNRTKGGEIIKIADSFTQLIEEKIAENLDSDGNSDSFWVRHAAKGEAADLFYHVGEGEWEKALKILDKSPELVHATNQLNTLLHTASRCEDPKIAVKMMEYFLERGIPIQSKGASEGTPLHQCKTVEAARYLISRGAVIDERNAKGATPIMRTPTKVKNAYLKLFIDAGADVTVVDRENQNLLGKVCSKSDAESLELAQYFLDRGVDPELKSYYGISPMDYASPEMKELFQKHLDGRQGG